MGDIAQRGNRLTFAKGGRAGHSLGHTAGRRLTERGAKSWNKKDITNKRISKDLVQDVFNVVARKHSLGQQGKPHSSKEGRTASFGRTVRDVRAEGGRSTKISKRGPVYNKNTGRKIIR